MRFEVRVREIHTTGPPNLREVEECDVFFVYITENWKAEDLEDPRRQELEYAKRLKKPIGVVVLDGVDVKPFLEGAEVVETLRLDAEKHQGRLREVLVEDFKQRTFEALTRRRNIRDT